jgi:hypothetical protein
LRLARPLIRSVSILPPEKSQAREESLRRFISTILISIGVLQDENDPDMRRYALGPRRRSKRYCALVRLILK